MANLENNEQENIANKAPLTPILLGFATIVALVIIIVMFVLNQNNISQTPAENTDENSIAIVDAGSQSNGVIELDNKPLADFTLVDNTGAEVNLSDFEGQYVLVYFGFTHCPDFCPTTLTDYKLIKRELGDLAENVEFVMISVDPKRDTPETLDKYLEPYDEDFIGLTAVVPSDGDALETARTALNPVTDDFGVFFQINDTGEVENYSVDHTSSKFLVNPDGELTTQYSYGTLVRDIVEDLRKKIAG